MRNYSDPKMSIVMFDAENVVTELSGIKNAANDQYFSKSTGTGTIAQRTVEANNILNFTEVQ